VVKLACPVRGCAEELRWDARPHSSEAAAGCARGHRFDIARSGYVNLLTPQDRRSRAPGDARAAVQARRRTLERGLGDALLEAVAAELTALGLVPGAAVLDVGCGEGFFLAALAARFGLEGWGVDLSTPAIDAAARRHPGQRWIVANADRQLPFADGSFQVALSITSRKNGAELRRLLAPDGRAVVVVPAADDLAELRAAVLGRAEARDKGARAAALLGEHFTLERERAARRTARLDHDALDDLLQGSYRGARHAARARFAAVGALEVTLAHEVLVFRPRP
jgi:23S rRNA (guanine745-N1)-methyltransferase